MPGAEGCVWPKIIGKANLPLDFFGRKRRKAMPIYLNKTSFTEPVIPDGIGLTLSMSCA